MANIRKNVNEETVVFIIHLILEVSKMLTLHSGWYQTYIIVCIRYISFILLYYIRVADILDYLMDL